MSRALPPLNSLRAFEAAARHQSFVQAAAELHVTPAAISHQIRELESRLGIELFVRHARGVDLSSLVARYRERVSAALRLLEDATARLMRVEIDGPLRLSVPASTAQFWLAPRLARLLAKFPGLQLQVCADDRLIDLAQGEADIAIRFGQGDYPGLHCRLLMSDAVSVLQANDGVQHGSSGTGGSPRVLLEDLGATEQEPWLSWPIWLRELRANSAETWHRVGFSDSGLALAACVAGAGMSINRLSLAYEYLHQQQLRAITAWRSTEFAYYLVHRTADAGSPRLLAFSDWLRAEVAEFAAEVQGTLGIALQTADG